MLNINHHYEEHIIIEHHRTTNVSKVSKHEVGKSARQSCCALFELLIWNKM